MVGALGGMYPRIRILLDLAHLCTHLVLRRCSCFFEFVDAVEVEKDHVYWVFCVFVLVIVMIVHTSRHQHRFQL